MPRFVLPQRKIDIKQAPPVTSKEPPLTDESYLKGMWTNEGYKQLTLEDLDSVALMDPLEILLAHELVKDVITLDEYLNKLI